MRMQSRAGQGTSSQQSRRSKAARVLLLSVVALFALPAGSAFAGNLVTTGHDVDGHIGEHDHFTLVATNFAKQGAPDTSKPVLAISCAGQMTSQLTAVGISNVGICPSADPAAFNALPLTTASYSAIAVGSSCFDDINRSGSCSVPGGSTPDSDLLNARAADIADFFNAGGGLFYASGENNGDGDPSTGPDTYYQSVPISLGGQSVNPPFRLTQAGRDIGLQDATNNDPPGATFDDINCCPTHNSFQEPAAGSVLEVAERDSTGAPETLVARGTISGGRIFNLTLDPASATNDVGDPHTVTAKLSDQAGPVASEEIKFTVTGANPTTGTTTTNASGEATFTYTGTAPGNDTITACFDADGNGTCESGEPSATASKTYVGAGPPPPPGPTISINDVSVTEGRPGTTVSAVFKVSLSSASTSPVTVDFTTADGSASAPSDYLAKSGTATFAPGDTEEDVSVTVNGDAVPEPDEDFFVNLSGATSATIADPQGVGTIKTDVTCPPGTSDPSYCVEALRSRAPLPLGRRGVVLVPVRCPASRAGGCRGRLTLRTSRLAPRKSSLARRGGRAGRRMVRLGARRYRIRAGTTKAVKVRLSKRTRRMVRRSRRGVRVGAVARERAGRRLLTRRIGTFTLKAGRRR